jgi:hypothetical protein
VSRGPSSLVTRPSLMPLRCRLTPRSFSSVVAGEQVRGPLLPTLGAFGRSSFTREHLVVVTASLTHVLVEASCPERARAGQLIRARVLGDAKGRTWAIPPHPGSRQSGVYRRGQPSRSGRPSSLAPLSEPSDRRTSRQRWRRVRRRGCTRRSSPARSAACQTFAAVASSWASELDSSRCASAWASSW